MEKRSIGKLEVSIVGVGCNQFGVTVDEQGTRDVVAAAIEHGVTLFDTADEYGLGQSETLLGRALRGRRDKVVIATKVGCRMSDDPAEEGASARWIRTEVENSLRRLGTDYIDLYQIHFPDPHTPIAETLDALAGLVRAGKVREIGNCNFTAPMLEEADAAAGAAGGPRFVSSQMHLNLVRQRAVTDLRPTCERLGIGILPYFPLASGLLTGKYGQGGAVPKGSRMDLYPDAVDKILSKKNLDRAAAARAWAQARGRSLLELAMGWLVSDPLVASVIAGATKPEQVAANVAASTWRLSPAEMAEASAAAA